MRLASLLTSRFHIAVFAFGEYMTMIRALIAERSFELAQNELRSVVEMYVVDSAPFESHLSEILVPTQRSRLVTSVHVAAHRMDFAAIDEALYAALNYVKFVSDALMGCSGDSA